MKIAEGQGTRQQDREIFSPEFSIAKWIAFLYACGTVIPGRNLVPDVEIIQWMDGWFSRPGIGHKIRSPKAHDCANVKNFLQSLHFRLQWEGMIDHLDAPIHQALRKVNPFARQEGS